LSRNRYPHTLTDSKALGRYLLASVFLALSGCTTTSSYPSTPSGQLPSKDLDISSYEVEFDLIQTQGLTKAQVAEAETSLISKIESRCTTPAYRRLDDATDRAAALIKNSMVLSAVDQYFADSEEIDKSARECMLRLGVSGAPYIITIGRGRMTMAAYAAAVREFAHQTATKKSEPAQILLYLPTGGCGSRGGPGYRLANGKCASWNQ
jgi:hypothetical protein